MSDMFAGPDHEKQVGDLILRLSRDTSAVSRSLDQAIATLIQFDAWYGNVMLHLYIRLGTYIRGEAVVQVPNDPSDPSKGTRPVRFSSVPHPVPTACVCVENGILSMVVNPVFWSWLHLTNVDQPPQYKPDGFSDDDLRRLFEDGMKRTIRRRVGLVKHEALHVVLSHFTRAREAKDRQRIEMAKEIEDNQWIQKQWLFPEDPTPERFGFPPKLTCEDYYQMLPPSPPQQGGGGGGFLAMLVGSGSGGNGGEDEDGQGSPQRGQGGGKGGKGDEGIDGLGGATKDDHGAHGQHNEPMTGEGGEEMPELEGASADENVQNLINRVIVDATEQCDASGRGRGTVPGWARELYERLRARATIPWEQILEQLMSDMVEARIRRSFRRPSRRNADIFPSRRRAFRFKYAIATDESGSVSDLEFVAFAIEIDRICEINEAGVRWLHTDADVGSLEDYGAWSHSWKREKRGGTDFQPTIDYCVEHGITDLIYFTDGQAPLPDARGVNILWVFTPGVEPDTNSWGGGPVKNFPGMKVYMKPNEQQLEAAREILQRRKAANE